MSELSSARTIDRRDLKALLFVVLGLRILGVVAIALKFYLLDS